MQVVENSIEIACRVNGKDVTATIPTSMTLADFVRHELELTGTKIACSQAVCGACTVLLDGQPVAACSVFAFEADGAEVLTIEGLADDGGEWDVLQTAFADLSAFQCGYCTSGMILLARALLNRNPNPSDEEIRKWMSSNICRCTGYELIVEAVKTAAGAKA